tara:strand:+ start:3605 stop:4489 length:885 start_codon:yes stop_codon:yes gene_type:complete
MSNEEIKKVIDFYFLKKKYNNDYVLHLDEEVEVSVINVNDNSVSKSFESQVGTGYDLYSPPYHVLKKDNIEKLNPDKIDVKFFWKYLTEKFPLFSVSQYPECKTDDDVNVANINAAKWIGFYQKVEAVLKTKLNSKVLEIGPGYGNFFKEITSKHPSANYYAIDVNKMFYYDGLFECDGSTVPEIVGDDFDLIFGINSFNHMSKNQRSSYYKSVYKKLVKGGCFLFTNYLISEHNKHRNDFWSYQDEGGKVYSSFFSQLIPIDDYNSLADELNDIGFSIKVKLSQNLATIECKK